MNPAVSHQLNHIISETVGHPLNLSHNNIYCVKMCNELKYVRPHTGPAHCVGTYCMCMHSQCIDIHYNTAHRCDHEEAVG